MRIAARSATARDFDAAAQKHANTFWFWLVVAAIIYYFLKWWAVIPALLAIWAAISSVGATKAASNLRNGRVALPYRYIMAFGILLSFIGIAFVAFANRIQNCQRAKNLCPI